jgi:hypothetical protein
MALQYSVAVRNAQLDALETTIGTAPTMEIRSGSPPADCAAADSGTLLVSITLPSDWMANAASGSKAKSGTWQGTASASGTAGHFRIKQSGTCHMQGTVGTSGADLIVDNTSINSGQTVTINTFTITAGNA